MSETGQINLQKVKATYAIKDIELVDLRDLEDMGDIRLYAEVSSGIALMLIGNLFSNFNATFFISAILFSGFAFFMGVRFLKKYKEARERVVEKEVDSDFQKQILNILYADVVATTEDLMKKMELDFATTKLILRSMVTSHLVRFNNLGKITYYYLYEKENEFLEKIRALEPSHPSASEVDIPF